MAKARNKAVVPKRPRGRQTVYTRELADTVIARMINGETLTQIGKDLGIGASTPAMWAADDRDGFAARYARARPLQAAAIADSALDVAEDLTDDPQSRRVRSEARKWLASKLDPAKFGDRQAIDLTVTNSLADRLEAARKRRDGGDGA